MLAILNHLYFDGFQITHENDKIGDGGSCCFTIIDFLAPLGHEKATSLMGWMTLSIPLIDNAP